MLAPLEIMSASSANDSDTLGYYVTSGDSRPTSSKYEVFDILSGRLDQITAKYEQLWATDVPGVNRQLAAEGYQEIEEGLEDR